MELTCIECPRGCDLKVEIKDGEIAVSRNFCPKGREYALAEATEPRRVVTSTVRAENGRVPVKTERAVKKTKIFSVMEKIRAAKVLKNTAIGDIIIENADGEGTNVIATAPHGM